MDNRNYLTVLLPEQKEILCKKRLLDAMTYSQMLRYIEREWGHEVSKGTVSKYFNSVEGQETMDRVHQEIKDKYLKEPLIEKSTRLKALQTEAQKIQRTLQAMSPGDEGYMDISMEFRQYLKMMRDEIEGSKVVLEGKSFSPAEEWAKARESLSVVNAKWTQ